MKKSLYILVVSLLCVFFAAVCFAAPIAVTGFDTALDNVAENAGNAQLSADVQGKGTQSEPYIITTAEEFNALSNLIQSNNISYGAAYYELGNNIDFTGKKLVPFGTADATFKGSFNGNGYCIYGVDVVDVENFGIIGYMSQGSVKNLSVNYSITSKKLSTMRVFGGIIGYAYTDSLNPITVTHCDVTGDVTLDVSADVYAGGVVGRVYANRANIVFSECASYSGFDITAVEGSTAGGFAGYTRASSTMYFQFYQCVAYGDVTLVTSGNRNMCGGFVGYVYRDEPGWVEANTSSLSETVNHFYICLAFGDVSTTCKRTARIGGFFGWVDNQAYVTFYGNQMHKDQIIEGNAKFINLCVVASDIYGDELYESTFLNKSLSYNFDVWYYNVTDNRLYLRPTAKKNGAADLRNSASIRLSEYNPGLRFTADIDMFKRDYVTEYGFILTTEKHLGANELTFDYGGKYAKGVAFDAETDIFFDKNDESLTFTGVLYNIPSTAYNQKVVARTYVKYLSNGITYTLYGNQVSASLYDIAQIIKNDAASYESLSQEQKQIFDEMFPEL